MEGLYDIGSDICRMVCTSIDPLHDICYLTGILEVLYDREKTVFDNKMKSIFLKVKEQG